MASPIISCSVECFWNNSAIHQRKYESKEKRYNQEIINSYDFLSNAASTQDCTGLIPSGPVNEDELESYEAVYHYQPPKIKNSKNKQEKRPLAFSPIIFSFSIVCFCILKMSLVYLYFYLQKLIFYNLTSSFVICNCNPPPNLLYYKLHFPSMKIHHTKIWIISTT